mgnify:FL=1
MSTENTSKEKFILTITANTVTSTDSRFDINNLGLGDYYQTLDVKFENNNGEIITRNYNKGERKNSNQTLPRLAFQIFEKEIVRLSAEEKEMFPICKYNPDSELKHGIYSSVESFRRYRNSIEYMKYSYGDGRLFVIYCWNLFSTIIFVQECLKRFGEQGDKFVLTYREKDIKESEEETLEANIQEELDKPIKEYRNPYSRMLIESKNIIFRGAPGTGKTYLAKQIAADIISDGYYDNYESLSEEQKQQIEFVQFHPSYDYSDFVEGLRPKINDGSMLFELQDGIFKKFVSKARANYENSQKAPEIIAKEIEIQEDITSFLDDVEFGIDQFHTMKGSTFYISSIDEKYIYITIPENNIVNKLSINITEIKKMLESGLDFKKVKDISIFFGKTFNVQVYSYYFAIFQAIKKSRKARIKPIVESEKIKKYIFIIDEINRGEISKIFGELFFAIDPGYRGRAGAITTQYSTMSSNEEKFYIPENVYIIGTMNDIDRSVDSFDFAMRRSFRFIEIKADSTTDMLDGLTNININSDSLENDTLKEEALNRMERLNKAIVEVEGLNENYQIGAAYFLKLKTLDFNQLWEDYLQPLLQEYIQGLYNEAEIMTTFANAYGYKEDKIGDGNGTFENKG